MSSRRSTPTVRLRRLAYELRRLREAAGLTREEVAERTGINEVTLYRTETARVRPQQRTLRTLLDMYEVVDPLRAELLAVSRDASRRDWLQTYSDLREGYTAFIQFEQEARSVHNYQSLLVPGLLQTEEYARAVIRAGLPQSSDKDDRVERRVQTRLERQKLLGKDDPLRLWAIVDEAALRRDVGGREVMPQQMHQLVRAADWPNVTVQVIPYRAGAHVGMVGSFAVLDFPNPADPRVVYIDSMAGQLFLEREPDLQRCGDVFDHLRAVALSPADSASMCAAIAEDAG